MKAFILLFLIVFASGGTVCYGEDSKSSADEKDVEVVEEIEIVDVSDTAYVGQGYVLGVPKHQALEISGPIIWLLMAAGIITRHIKIIYRIIALLKSPGPDQIKRAPRQIFPANQKSRI